MYIKAADILKKQNHTLAANVTKFVQENFPYRTKEYEKCTRDVSYIITAIETCLKSGNTQHIDYVSKLFFKGGILQLKTTDVEMLAYDFLIRELKKILIDVETGSLDYCESLINRLKNNLQCEMLKNTFDTIEIINDKNLDRETKVKRVFYNWDSEMALVRNMQKCQRNWDYSRSIRKEMIDYLLWHAENAPSKQHEAYYDVYWTADRKVIEEYSKYTWGSTHSRNPPSTWRNTQANANMYMLFVAKEPETQLNCHSDGTLKSNTDPARWENAYVSIGIAMGLVMRAANALGLSTGCNKSHGDINGDMFWERKLGIEEDVLAGRKNIAYGIGIGYPQQDRPRWETDDYELAIGAGNGSNLTTDLNMDTHPVTGRKMRKVKIVDIRTTDKAIDPYSVEHDIPSESSIKINTMRKRIINITEIK
jgi:nitroreductase